MEKTSALLDKYISRSMATVQGYLTVLDARIIAALLSYQDQHGISGNLCEIGVHHGRLFLMLALARRNGDRALAIDLFEDDAINSNTRHAGRSRALTDNAHRLGIELLEAETFKTSSLAIKPPDILARTCGKVRFFSVDGCHLYDEVGNGLRLAEQTLTPDGVIAADDFFNVEWADVSFAVGDFLVRTKRLVPFAITSKLYLAPPDAAEKYRKALMGLSDFARIIKVQILGQDVLALKDTNMRRGYQLIRGLVAGRD